MILIVWMFLWRVCVCVCTIPDWFCLLWSRSLRLLTFTQLADSLLISPELLECTVEYITSLVPSVCCWITRIYQRHASRLLIFSGDSSKLCHKANRLLQYEVIFLVAYYGRISKHQIAISILGYSKNFITEVLQVIGLSNCFFENTNYSFIFTQIVGAMSLCSRSFMKQLVYRKLNSSVVHGAVQYIYLEKAAYGLLLYIKGN